MPCSPSLRRCIHFKYTENVMFRRAYLGEFALTSAAVRMGAIPAAMRAGVQFGGRSKHAAGRVKDTIGVEIQCPGIRQNALNVS